MSRRHVQAVPVPRLERGPDAPARCGAGRFAAVVVATAVVALALAPPLPSKVPLGFQPVFGVVLGALLLLPRRRWGAVLAGAATFELVVHGVLHHGGLFAADVLWRSAIALVVTPLVAASLLALGGEARGQLVPASRLVRFLAIILVAGLAVPVLTLIGSGLSMQVRFVAAHSVAVGMLVVTPVMLAWGRPFPVHRRVAEAVAVGLAVLVAGSVVFLSPSSIREVTRPYWMVLPMAWAALRFGLRGGAWSILVTAEISMWATALGHGPFVAASGETPAAIIYSQLFVAVVAVATLLMASAVEDLRDRREVECRLWLQAYHDDLTGLPNRAMILEELARRPSEPARPLVLLICDIDRLRVINDGLGHHNGDRLLIEVAARIRGCVRPEDALGRLAGDEFVVITQDCAPGAVESITSRILAAVGQPYEVVGSVHVRTSMSIGTACSFPGMTPMEVLRHADAALHRAKSQGRGRVSRFDQELRAEVSERLLLEADFLPALEAGEVHWHFQPEIDLLSGQVLCLEALCRWDHRDMGPIEPDRFVPIVEAAGRSRELFARALDAALEVQEELRLRLGTLVPVAVNLSPSMLDDDGVVALVRASLDRVGAEARALCIEVTEDALIATDADRVLRGLHSLGVLLAVDDFGKGWSSMERLASFPWDVLKIDRSFVGTLGEGSMSGRHQQMVGAIVAIARSLDAIVVAEGVETESQLAAVRELDCDVVQGWVFSKAVDHRELSGLIDPVGTWAGAGHELLGHPSDARLGRP